MPLSDVWPKGRTSYSASRLVNTPIDCETEGSKTVAIEHIHQALLHEIRPAESAPDGRSDDPSTFSSSDLDDSLYERLYTVASNGQLEDVDELVRHLHHDRGHPLNGRMYGARILANINAHRGSAAKVATLLQEMKDEGIPPDTGTYHHILEVLAVHPDYLLRGQVLEEMRRNWIDVSPAGLHCVAAGLVRDGQLELALDAIENMRREGVDIAPWLHNLIVYSLLDREEFDEALRMIKSEHQIDDRSVSPNMWHRLLDLASRALHHQAVVYAWRHRVEKHHLIPSDGICLNVLDTASRHGDADLATDVFRLLASRGTILELQHYEALSEAYLVRDDIETALTVHCIAEKAGIKLEEASASPVVKWVGKSPERLQRARNAVRELHYQGRAIPVATVNSLLHASISRGMNAVVELYNTLRELCPGGPNVETFNLLILGCIWSSRLRLGLHWHSEMLAVKIEPNAETYNRLIELVCRHGNYEDGFQLLDEMKEKKFQPSQRAYLQLLERCAYARDERAWPLVEEMERVGHSKGLARKKLEAFLEQSNHY
ncbi:MAG: hypothetical protein M1823_004481 [Watsoniomyces obsoletus]|nr:MAG: hypothetical protein M1823_004481 [Watsoniomyces obsoletus]